MRGKVEKEDLRVILFHGVERMGNLLDSGYMF